MHFAFRNLSNSNMSSESQAEFRSAGMSQHGLDGFEALSKKFESELPAGDEAAIAMFLADFQADTQKHVESLSSEDRKIYEDHKKRVEDGDDD